MFSNQEVTYKPNGEKIFITGNRYHDLVELFDSKGNHIRNEYQNRLKQKRVDIVKQIYQKEMHKNKIQSEIIALEKLL